MILTHRQAAVMQPADAKQLMESDICLDDLRADGPMQICLEKDPSPKDKTKLQRVYYIALVQVLGEMESCFSECNTTLATVLKS